MFTLRSMQSNYYRKIETKAEDDLHGKITISEYLFENVEFIC